MSSPRVIKKYPNRRLYDTTESRYITLADVRALVMRDVEFQVIEKKSGDDITPSILLQVISEQEQHGDTIMSQNFLEQIIRAYGAIVPGRLARFLEQSVRSFMSGQAEAVGEPVRTLGHGNGSGIDLRPDEASRGYAAAEADDPAAIDVPTQHKIG